MSTFGLPTPRLSRGVPPPSVVPRERVYGRPPEIKAVQQQEMVITRRMQDIADAWAAGFKAAELMYGTTVSYGPAKKEPRNTVSVRKIVAEVAKKHELNVEEIMGDYRAHDIVTARHEAMWRCSKELPFSIARIGREFNGKDHTTVMNAIKRHEQRMAKEAKAA